MTTALQSPVAAAADTLLRGSPGHRSAFTLIELMAALAMMALLVVIVGSLMVGTSSLIKTSNKKIDADSEARTVLDRMGGDFAAMVKRSDVDYQFNNLGGTEENGSASLFFYSEAPAIAAPDSTSVTTSTASLIGYRINDDPTLGYQLQRLGKGLQWSPPNSMVYLTYASYPATTASMPLPASTLDGAFSSTVQPGSVDSDYHVLGPHVFRFYYWFLLKPQQQPTGAFVPASFSPSPYSTADPAYLAANGQPYLNGHNSLPALGLQDVQAIVVTIALLDPTSRLLLPPGTNWAKIAAALPDPAATTPLVPPTWNAIVARTASFAAAAGIPAAAASQVRIYERTFNLVTTPIP